MSTQSTFDQLCQHTRETALLSSTLALLEWDQQTKLPAAAHEHRSKQVTFLAGMIHQRTTDPKLGQWLLELSSQPEFSGGDSEAAVTVRELKKQYDRQVKLPAALVENLASAASTGQTLWVEARKNNDFASFAPQLKLIFDLKREQADAIGYDHDRYDALLDEYEPGATTQNVSEVLTGLCEELVPLVAAIRDSAQHPDTSILSRHYPVESQKQFGLAVSSAVGFDYQRGRLDITHHPFCTELGPNDCRITTRYDENFFNSAFFGTLHEAGHGIYEQGLRGDQYGLPLGNYCSLGIHESQSRMWENLVGRNRSFWNHFFPKAQVQFPEALSGVDLDSFYRAVNAVGSSLIRVEADEATYNLHIIIRFELEQAVIGGELETKDLPDAWNEKYEKYLGIKPPDDASGVLQDVHWAAGLVGYFPTYSLGNLYASQMFEAAQRALGDLPKMFSAGEFEPLKKWLNEQIHEVGREVSGPELGKRVTGQELSHDALMRHLRTKYAEIYNL